jgi:hypothetical protein
MSHNKVTTLRLALTQLHVDKLSYKFLQLFEVSISYILFQLQFLLRLSVSSSDIHILIEWGRRWWVWFLMVLPGAAIAH